jgi:hypothetical protein
MIRLRRLYFCLALAVLSVSSASAEAKQALPPDLSPGLREVFKDLNVKPSTPPTPAQIAEARAEADTILAAADAGDVFENVSADGGLALKHKMSGVVCIFNHGSPLNKVMIFHDPRGTSVGCNTSQGSHSLSLFIDRVPSPPPALEKVASLIAGQIQRRYPDAQRSTNVLTASGKDAAGNDLPPHIAFVYTRASSHGPMEEREALGYVGEWFLQQRITEPEANGMAADLLNEIVFQAFQREILSAQSAVLAH